MKEFTRNAAKVRFIWFEKYLRDFVSLETIFERMCLDFIKKQKKKNSFREAVAQTCFVKKVFLEILQNSQENICARVPILIKLQAKKTFSHRTTQVATAAFHKALNAPKMNFCPNITTICEYFYSFTIYLHLRGKFLTNT